MTRIQNMITPNIVREGCNGYSAIHLEDQLLLNREIFLNGEISSETMESVIQQLLYLSRSRPAEEIILYINSPGGDVDSGLAIYDTIQLIKTPVHTVCVGMAASMGAILFLAGTHRSMLPHSHLMIHDPFVGSAPQNARVQQLEEAYARLRKTRQVLRDIVLGNSDLTESELSQNAHLDNYYDATAALAHGLAHDIVTSLK